jgi:two-component system, response regulator PdtaR
MAGLKILIVEDDGLVATILEELLVAMGHAVCAIETTQAGAAKAAAGLRPDLLLIDVGLAEGDGPAAMATITQARKVPHVFMTGGAIEPDRLAPGAVVLRKPFSERLLAQAMARALAQPRV